MEEEDKNSAMSNPSVPKTVYDFEKHVKKTLSTLHSRYLFAYATHGRTYRANESAFQKLSIIPDHLVPVGNFDPSLDVLGSHASMPIGIAPTAYQKVFHADGETAMVRAAQSHKVVHIMSESSSTLLEDVAKAAPDAVRWMQIQFSTPKDMSLDLARRAKAAGCKALVLTIDWPVFPRVCTFDMMELFGPGSPTYVNQSMAHESHLNPEQTWDDVAELIRGTDLPVIIKGVLNPSSVVKAKQVGATGIIVSNHGGTTLDGVPASIEMLPHVAEAVAEAGGGLDIYMDGGVRTGADVFKAVALGAKMVFVGRPALCGLVYNGQKGVEEVLQVLKDEFINTAQMACTPTLEFINRNRVISQAKLDQF